MPSLYYRPIRKSCQSGYDDNDDDDGVQIKYVMHARIHALKSEIVVCHIDIDVFNHN